MKYRFLLVILGFFFLLISHSCKKFLEVPLPVDQVVADYVYESEPSAIAVLTGIYSSLSSASAITGQSSMTLYSGLLSDELTLMLDGPGIMQAFYVNGLSPLSVPMWSELYGFIYRSNAAIEGLNKSQKLSPGVKRQLLGEAKFIRAFCYFYLVNFFGDVPLLVGTDYKINMSLPRASVASIYTQIVNDLSEARESLDGNYLDANSLAVTTQRVRPNKYCAIALLARAYLYSNNWKDAELATSEVIERNDLYDTVALDEVFLKNSKEAIWQLQPNSMDIFNTEEARLFILENGPDISKHPVYLSQFQLDAFQNGDQRKLKWVGIDSTTGEVYYYPLKYKKYKIDDPETEYLMVLRLSEQYLIRAEARIQQGNIVGANSDINVIRKRAGLENIFIDNKQDFIQALLKERQSELFTEWAHRWFDIKRLNVVDVVMSLVTPKKGGTWRTWAKLLPIPQSDILYNRNLTQNEGYYQ